MRRVFLFLPRSLALTTLPTCVPHQNTQLADPTFRRQILVQILILFHYLLGFSPAERSRTEKLPVTNMSAYPAYVLPSEVETWVRELRSRTLDELDDMEGGRKFRKAVQLVLQRDQNWVRAST